ncbi:F-box family protein [Striga asiatica]|uniref:F-box family protein n=1 Tax=Striga asiatica TaxID=4170 RepID=A0A5A7R9B7_STRAF|nr:F-box family protein [Striga asiatica]
MAIMSLNPKSKLKPLLNLCRTFSNAPLPVCSKDKSKFIVPQYTAPGRLNCLVISIEDTTHKLERDINYPKLFHNPVGACNGLVLLDFYGSYDKDTDTETSRCEALWNPTTNELKILPPSPATLDPRDALIFKSSCMYFGFGFDSASEDYKVIRFVIPRVNDANMMAELYSLATNSWKPVNVPPRAGPCWGGIHVNGSYYGKSTSEPGFITSFNCATEKFASCPIHVPQSEKLNRPYSNLTLVEFRGSLGAVVDLFTCRTDPLRSLEVWVWDDIKWTWSLVSTFDVPRAMSAWSLVGSDKIIFVESLNRDLMVFDYATGKLENIAGAPQALVPKILPFVESYIPLN